MDQAKQIDDTIPLPGSKRTIFEFGTFDHSEIPLEKEEIPVIIIGSSMVGFSIHSTSFDRHPSTAIHPRAALFLLRTVEVLRQLGLEDLFVAESEKNFDLDAGMLVVEKLYQGKIIAAHQESDPIEVAKVTPCKRLWLTQDMFEPLLRRNAAKYDAEQRFGQVVMHYEECADGVIVVVREVETGALKKYKTKYLVAADGNRSATRQREGIEWHGPGHLANSISINFKANLVPYLGTRAVHGVTYIMSKHFTGGFRLDAGGKGGFLIVSRAENRESGFKPDSVSANEARQYFEACSGINADECGFEVDFISYWTVAAYNADKYTSEAGRVFLMGDAAHTMPPAGGMGGNTGVAMAYVLTGRASEGLLDTYNSERQPAGDFSMNQAFSRLVNRVFRDRSSESVKELPDLVCELGYRYAQDTVDSGVESDFEDPHEPLVLAGCRLPHVWLIGENGKRVSSLDLVKRNFVLLTVDVKSPWMEAAGSQRIPVDAYAINASSNPYRESERSAKEVWKLQEDEALLVRPDGIIAWRAVIISGGHVGELGRALDLALKH
ncbi:hypothetical protein E4T48_04412 [Aureobasidium sp. EXF-10727]|nr:hypothetical protein E4T48_04412 [Aureobasidium sp. EXF-10727]KAI4724691.1 hypothetical protein E4T49_07589 [Aureobasidium sp. EXF-10728]